MTCSVYGKTCNVTFLILADSSATDIIRLAAKIKYKYGENKDGRDILAKELAKKDLLTTTDQWKYRHLQEC